MGIGWVKCAHCGHVRFEWHTYFLCPKCGGKTYEYIGLTEKEKEEFREGRRINAEVEVDYWD